MDVFFNQYSSKYTGRKNITNNKLELDTNEMHLEMIDGKRHDSGVVLVSLKI